MAKKKKNARTSSRWDSEARLLIWLATCVSVMSFLFYFQHGQVLLYGDAVAHMNIARRVFDSKTPGLLQLGTVWLPLPHLLMIPFLISHEMWQRGAGGSIPSMIAYVFGVVGIFRLVRGTLSSKLEPDAPARVSAWIAALVYATNPNLIYMQTTAMGEALYLAFFVWTVVYFSESLRGDKKALVKCGLCVAAACLTRYDGWFLAVALSGTVVCLGFISRPAPVVAQANQLAFTKSAIVKFVLLAAFAPTLWLAYNAIVYRNPLEFENGPYSAKAIERKTQTAGNLGHPGSRNLAVASSYFLKSAEANMAENSWLQRAWVLIAGLGIAGIVLLRRSSPLEQPASTFAVTWLPLLVLLIPGPFYALSVAYGGVPIFVPAWWPFTHYNVRYGLQLLPAFAVALAIIVCLALRSDQMNTKLRFATILASITLLIASYASVWRATPISLKEAQLNMRTRNQLEYRVAAWLEQLPPNCTILMYLGDHVGAVQQAGIPLQHVINEGNHRVWKQPSDLDGLWERALANPAQYADYVLAFEGDPVWQAVSDRHLHSLLELHVMGQAPAVLYSTR
jgi:hypothetical protein